MTSHCGLAPSDGALCETGVRVCCQLHICSPYVGFLFSPTMSLYAALRVCVRGRGGGACPILCCINKRYQHTNLNGCTALIALICCQPQAQQLLRRRGGEALCSIGLSVSTLRPPVVHARQRAERMVRKAKRKASKWENAIPMVTLKRRE